jgi:hypothetical protein
MNRGEYQAKMELADRNPGAGAAAEPIPPPAHVPYGTRDDGVRNDKDL